MHILLISVCITAGFYPVYPNGSPAFMWITFFISKPEESDGI